MKKLISYGFLLLLFGAGLSACASSKKGKGGGWYRNRNHVYQPKISPAILDQEVIPMKTCRMV